MANNKKDLKAYVRFDGSGRVVAGSLILRRTKPKVGNWMQIQAYECCDPYFTTTTTSTSSTSTTSTTSTTTTAPSDIRLKSNITLTGNMIGGLKEYSWTWNSKAVGLGFSNYNTVGVLAQEALEKYPQAVFMANDGYLRVDYSKIV